YVLLYVFNACLFYWYGAHRPLHSFPTRRSSDLAGIVDGVGDGVDNVKAGDEVIINPSLGWRKNSDAPPEGFEIVGMPFDGTFAECITLPAENAVRKRGYLS